MPAHRGLGQQEAGAKLAEAGSSHGDSTQPAPRPIYPGPYIFPLGAKRHLIHFAFWSGLSNFYSARSVGFLLIRQKVKLVGAWCISCALTLSLSGKALCVCLFPSAESQAFAFLCGAEALRPSSPQPLCGGSHLHWYGGSLGQLLRAFREPWANRGLTLSFSRAWCRVCVFLCFLRVPCLTGSRREATLSGPP